VHDEHTTQDLPHEVGQLTPEGGQLRMKEVIRLGESVTIIEKKGRTP
jgi:hypothetical protein